MKLEPRRVEAFLRDPGEVRVALLYGDDAGLIRDRAVRLVRTVAGSADDPFRVVELEPDAVGNIPAEMASLPMTGGRRVVRVRDAGDATAGPVQAALSGRGSGFLILEAGVLGPRSKLRTLVERAAGAVSIGCYPPEGRGLEQAIQGTLSELGVSADADALAWLGGQLGADQAMTRMEVEKLALHAGPRGPRRCGDGACDGRRSGGAIARRCALRGSLGRCGGDGPGDRTCDGGRRSAGGYSARSADAFSEA